MTPEPPTAVERELAAIDAALAGHAVEPDLADVAELARALREDRPEPDVAFARELDAWAAAGYRSRDARRPRSGARKRPAKRFVLFRPQALAVFGAVAALGLGTVVVGSVDLPNGSDDSGSAAGGSGGEVTKAMDESSGGGAAESAAPGGQPEGELRREARRAPQARSDAGADRLKAAPGQPAPTRGRYVEQSAAMTIATAPDELEGVAADVSRVTARAGGYVARSSVTADPGGGMADFELRVPSARLNTVLADLAELGDVRSRTQASDDITANVASASERAAELRAERRGLLRRLARTGDPAVRLRLRYVSAQLRDAKAALRNQKRRAALSTVAVTLTGDPEAGAATGGGRWTPGDALRDAARVLEVVAGVALIALAVALPLVLIGVPLLIAGRRFAQRGRERALDLV